MACRCENMQRARELDRMRHLAKALARMESQTVVLFQRNDGTYDFDTELNYRDEKGTIVEYITRY